MQVTGKESPVNSSTFTSSVQALHCFSAEITKLVQHRPTTAHISTTQEPQSPSGFEQKLPKQCRNPRYFTLIIHPIIQEYATGTINVPRRPLVHVTEQSSALETRRSPISGASPFKAAKMC
ncbi:hypothetical protein CPC08DRAFT_121006 [Agrocybe pediades]|nr:hypothetical protein CPC08DRAFT_121006 [Agrocybe pediades]